MAGEGRSRSSSPINDIREEELALPQVPALTLIADAEEQGKALTVLEDQWLVAVGAVVLPKEPSENPNGGSREMNAASA